MAGSTGRCSTRRALHPQVGQRHLVPHVPRRAAAGRMQVSHQGPARAPVQVAGERLTPERSPLTGASGDLSRIPATYSASRAPRRAFTQRLDVLRGDVAEAIGAVGVGRVVDGGGHVLGGGGKPRPSCAEDRSASARRSRRSRRSGAGALGLPRRLQLHRSACWSRRPARGDLDHDALRRSSARRRLGEALDRELAGAVPGEHRQGEHAGARRHVDDHAAPAARACAAAPRG